MSGMDIVTFLTARLDEDGADARAAIADRSDTQRWEAHGWLESGRMEWIVRDAEEKYASYGYPGYTPVAAAMPGGPRDGGGVAAHIARHDPARVLRDVAAKRAIIEQWQQAAEETRKDENDPAVGAMGATLMGVLVSLASGYSEHPDYAGDDVDDWTWPDDDPAWRVE